jgi:hypothetical protein
MKMIDIYLFHEDENPWKVIAKRYDKFSVSARVALKMSRLSNILFAEYGSKIAKYVRQTHNNYIS